MGIVIFALFVTDSSTTIGNTKTTDKPTAVKGCKHVFTARESRQFTKAVWSYKKWQRAKLPRAVLRAYKTRLACAAGPGHRKAIRSFWRAEKAAYEAHRSYKLRWGSCGDAGPVRDCIHGAALTYGADEGWMLTVSYCESTWNRYARNRSGSTGLFQFMLSTWETTPYGSKDIYSVKWQSLAAAWMYVQGRTGEWVCQA